MEAKIHDSPAFPVVGDLLASTVDDVSDLVGYYELLVLSKLSKDGNSLELRNCLR